MSKGSFGEDLARLQEENDMQIDTKHPHEVKSPNTRDELHYVSIACMQGRAQLYTTRSTKRIEGITRKN